MFKPTPNPPPTDPTSPYDPLDPKKLNEAAERARPPVTPTRRDHAIKPIPTVRREIAYTCQI